MVFAPRTAEVHIFQGDDESRIRQLEQAARAAREDAEGSAATLMESPEWLDLASQHDAAVSAALERATKVTLSALPRKRWRSMVAEYPPREGHRGDQAVGVNEDALADDLVLASVMQMEPEPDEGRASFFDAISDAQFESLYLTAFSLNRGMAAAPKAGLLTELSQSSDAT